MNLPFFLLSNNWNITKRWAFITSYQPTDKILEEFGITELPAISAVFPESTNIGEGYL